MTKEDKTAGPSSKFLHKVELGDSREHVNRLVDFGEAPAGGFPSWNLRYIKTLFLPSLSDNRFIKSHMATQHYSNKEAGNDRYENHNPEGTSNLVRTPRRGAAISLINPPFVGL